METIFKYNKNDVCTNPELVLALPHSKYKLVECFEIEISEFEGRFYNGGSVTLESGSGFGHPCMITTRYYTSREAAIHAQINFSLHWLHDKPASKNKTNILKLISDYKNEYMKPLKKGFEASEKTVAVKIQGEYYEVANMKKSGIVNQSTVLLAIGDKWHEVNVLDLGADDSNLDNFKHHVELHGYKLKDFGIYNEVKTAIDFTLKHEDFMQLSEQFPKFNYIQIAKLDTYYKTHDKRSSVYIIKSDLKRLTERDQTIEQWIDWLEAQKYQIINNDKSKFVPMKTQTDIDQRTEARQFQLFKMKLTPAEDGSYTGHGFTVTQISIESDPDENWDALMARINEAANPQQATPIAQAAPVEETEEEAPTGDYVNTRITQITEIGFETADGDVYTHAVVEEQIPFSTITDMDTPQWDQLMADIENKISNAPTAQPAATPEQLETAAATPAAATEAQEPAKKPVSLEVIGNLPPQRITELQELATKQQAILDANPLIDDIRDAATLKKAETSMSALLKASTAIDSPKTGIKANKNRFLKKLSDTLDTFLDPLARKTRDRYDKQKLIVDGYKNKEALRLQEEKRKATQKIVDRTNELFAVPMVFNGELYTIGTLHILPSQIETAEDAAWAALVAEAQKIKKEADEAAEKPDPMVLVMAESIAEATGKTVEVVLAEMKAKAEAKANAPQTHPQAAAQPQQSAPAAAQTPAAAADNTLKTAPATTGGPNTAIPAKADGSVNTLTVSGWVEEKTYTKPDPANMLLVALDEENAHALDKPAYIKVRSFYKRGAKELAAEIRKIFASDHPVKSQAIKELLTIIENS